MLRKVTAEDFNKLFNWVNDKEVRKNARYTEEKTLEEYKEWFNNALEDESLYMFILVVNKEEVGQVKFEISEEEVIFNYSIDTEHRGKGFGTATIRESESLIAEKLGQVIAKKKLTAYVRTSNTPSCRVFERLNYSKVFACEDYVKFQKTLSAK